MTNIFILDFESRLRSWADLREKSKLLSIPEKYIAIDDFWQQVPFSNHYLHADFIKDWPDPWQLLHDNTYCSYAKALGMIYTLLLLGNKSIDLVEAKDDNNNEVVLVLVDDAKYVMNYWPGTVLNNRLQDFVITKTLDWSPLLPKIGL